MDTNSKKTVTRFAYPTRGRITEDDPSIWGSAVLGWEGCSWAAFHARHQPSAPSGCENPYRKGCGQGFGSTEDGEDV